MNQQETKKIIDIAIQKFHGQLTDLEGAIGTFLVGQKMGWKILYLAHDRRTLKKYEKILDVDFREVLPGEGALSHKSYAWQAMQKISNFWKAVKGEITIPRRKELE